MQFIKNSIINSLGLHYKKLILMLCVYSLYISFVLNNSITHDMGFWEFVLFMITDFRLITFCLLPLYGFYIFSSASKIEIPQIIRFKSFNKYFVSSIVPDAVFSFLYASAPLFISLFLSLIFRKSYSSAQLSNEFLTHIVAYFNDSVILTIIISTFYLFFGLMLLSVVIKFLLFIIPRKIVTVSCLAVYLLTVLSVQWNIDSVFPYVFLNNYIILIDAVRNNCLFINSFISVIIFALIFVATKKRWGCSDIC